MYFQDSSRPEIESVLNRIKLKHSSLFSSEVSDTTPQSCEKNMKKYSNINVNIYNCSSYNSKFVVSIRIH